ncbi:MAG: large conductance mechanosensitive channel protein MscL [Ruminococcaceae bacterium]|nr:large conductance mechanosensitive channel protein MscL [Oscillospiraceae bacterium]
MKKFFGEFKKFITRGNVLDMAVGVIVGGAFTAIVNGVSNFVLKPLINWVLSLILGKDALSEMFTFLTRVETTDAVTGESVVDLANSIYIDWGSLINAIINFIITALVLFLIVKFINKVKEESADTLSKEDKAELKARGIKRSNTEAVQAYLVEKAEAKAKAEAEAAEAARLERLANPTTEDLLKEILAEMKKS